MYFNSIMTLLDTLPLLCNQSIPMRRNVLPVELSELVIDLIDDEKTLRATSLVCKAWLARSRFNLFRVVELQIPNHLDRLLDLLTDTPDVAPLIKEIAISENSLLSLFRPALSIVARFPHSLSAHPRLQPRRLMVHHQLWIPTRYDAGYLCGLSQYSCITSLDLFDVTFDSVADFSIVIRALRNLESLSATYVECERGMHSDILRAIGSELPSLTSLRVNSPSPTLAADWLLQYNTFPFLTTVDISYEICHSIFESDQGLGPFWVSTGSTLEHLCLGISKKGSASQIPLEYIRTYPSRASGAISDHMGIRTPPRPVTLHSPPDIAPRLQRRARGIPGVELGPLPALASSPHRQRAPDYHSRLPAQLPCARDLASVRWRARPSPRRRLITGQAHEARCGGV